MLNRPIKNVGFISTRIAGTDGVSLEIAKWVEILERNRFDCFFFAGQLSTPKSRSMAVEEAFFDHPDIKEITESVFGVRTRQPEITAKIHRLKEKIKAELYRFIKKFDIDLLIPENALTIPMNIPLGLAITEFINETGIPTIAHHHDFFWERDRFLVNACQDYLNMAFPPDHPHIRHVVINSLASKELSYRVGISNTIIPNVLDFEEEPIITQRKNCKLREIIGLAPDEPFILQPTRIVPRKWIERSIEIVSYLNLKKPMLVISHSAGDEGQDYYQRIVEYADKHNIQLALIDHLIGDNRRRGGKKYTIEDVYRCADLITYPSGYEGFGNAFLEAIYYMKPIVVNRYSIYRVDIEPKGFDVITIDGFATKRAITRIKRVLKDEELRERMVKKNYELAKKYFSYEVAEEKLIYLINTFKP
ncbi:glycosyltransferase [Calditrichota bacterium LG25]